MHCQLKGWCFTFPGLGWVANRVCGAGGAGDAPRASPPNPVHNPAYPRRTRFWFAHLGMGQTSYSPEERASDHRHYGCGRDATCCQGDFGAQLRLFIPVMKCKPLSAVRLSVGALPAGMGSKGVYMPDVRSHWRPPSYPPCLETRRIVKHSVFYATFYYQVRYNKSTSFQLGADGSFSASNGCEKRMLVFMGWQLL